MKAIIVLGSRNPEGRTARAANALLEGLKDEGGQGEAVCLPHKKIERCRQCEQDGWGICRTEGRCVIEDDFASLMDKIRDADAAIFATPVYFSDLSESIRSFLDRLRRVTRHESGRDGIGGKPAIGICLAGGGGGGGGPQTWQIVSEYGDTATLTVDSSGNFTGSGWVGSAPGLPDYNIYITNGRMSGTSMTFEMTSSYSGGQLNGTGYGELNASFPGATSAFGSSEGIISDPLGTRDFYFQWDAWRI